MRLFLFRRISSAGALAALCLASVQALAATVETRLASGITATAEFRPGQPEKPAVLFLHGFLQTRQAMPLSVMAENLAGQGYTTLNPTLSLDINRRGKILACEAAHTHSMAKDVAELGHWVDWLARKGYRSIILVGHSVGSTQTLHYATQHPNPAVRKVILTSLIGLLSDPADRQRALEQARKAPDQLQRYTLSYCKKNYTSPPRAFLSYADNSTDNTLALLAKARVPAEVILGANDATMEAGWPDRLKNKGVAVTVIANTGHFFDGEAEFDLTDKLEARLKSLPAGN